MSRWIGLYWMLLRSISLLCFALAALELIIAGGNGSLLLLALGIAFYNRSELLELKDDATIESKERV